MTGPVIRDLAGMDEFLAAEALQRTVWGADDLPDPADLMMVIQHEGGLVAGAFNGSDLVGYVFGFPTRDPAIQHSHRLAVHPGKRGGGLAVQLKWYQRQWCLQRGITLVRWTFDPLRRTNAHLNIGRLGAIVRTYHCDYYGEMKGINAGLPSDRVLAEWFLNDARVAALAAGEAASMPAGTIKRISIATHIDGLLASDPDLAMAERLRVRAEMTALLSNGFTVVGFDNAGSSYLLALDASPTTA